MKDKSESPEQAMGHFDIEGRVAVVTGASSGLGCRFARVLHGAGAHVVLVARRAERLEVLANELPGSAFIPADVTDEASLELLSQRVSESHGGLDILVNGAGISASSPAVSESLTTFRQVVEVNLLATFHMCQIAARQMMRRGGGSIVNVASIFGIVGCGRVPLASYVASKGAVVSLTRELALQWAGEGIRVNAIAPGYFRSEMTEARLAKPDDLKWIQQMTPLGRIGAEGELDGPLLFLASDASSYVTGQILAIDGGWTTR